MAALHPHTHLWQLCTTVVSYCDDSSGISVDSDVLIVVAADPQVSWFMMRHVFLLAISRFVQPEPAGLT